MIVRRPEDGGNVLVDSARFNRPLARRIREMGGIRTMFLTHCDDIADHPMFAREFGCARIMHVADGVASLGIEHVIDRADPLTVDEDLLAIPTPCHTRGHMVLLYRERFLFTGDHLAWWPGAGTLKAFRDVCWYSWRDQIRSMERLLD